MILELLKKIWKDPVWSKVIASGIVGLIIYLTSLYSTVVKDILIIPIPLWISLISIVVCSFIVFIFSLREEKFKYNDKTLEHDQKLYNKLVYELLPSNGSISFVRSNNFAGFSFSLDHLKEIDNVHYLDHDPNYEFLHPDLELIRKNLFKTIDEFEYYIGIETFPTSDGRRQTIPPNLEIEDPEHFRKAVNKIHSSARTIGELHDELVRRGRMILLNS